MRLHLSALTRFWEVVLAVVPSVVLTRGKGRGSRGFTYFLRSNIRLNFFPTHGTIARSDGLTAPTRIAAMA